MKPEIVLIVHNIRSSHNVGSLLRTADGLGVAQLWLTGYTPYPTIKNDSRLPHIAEKTNKQIKKTSLGAETSVKWHHSEDIKSVVTSLRKDNFIIVALEQSDESIPLPTFIVPPKVAIIVGNEVDGVDSVTLGLCDLVISIPMLGQKESFNVVQAAAMVLYHSRFGNLHS